MDIRHEKYDPTHGKPTRATHGHPAMRTLALALALATLPAIGAGIGQADALDPTTAPVPTHVQAPAAATTHEATVAPIDRAPGRTPGIAPSVTDPSRAMSTTAADTLPPAPAAEVAPAEPVDVIQVEAPSAIATLEPGEFLWHPEVAPSGPVVVVVSLPEQRAHVYRNGLRIGVSTISSGKPGHSTPTGTFPILQKRVEHYSNLYDDAPMPYMQRLTWDGVALHAGRIPGYPASHGCIRLPREFAELLYDVTSHGTTVVVADESSHSADVVFPGTTSPVDSYTGLEMPEKADVAALAQFGGHY